MLTYINFSRFLYSNTDTYLIIVQVNDYVHCWSSWWPQWWFWWVCVCGGMSRALPHEEVVPVSVTSFSAILDLDDSYFLCPSDLIESIFHFLLISLTYFKILHPWNITNCLKMQTIPYLNVPIVHHTDMCMCLLFFFWLYKVVWGMVH